MKTQKRIRIHQLGELVAFDMGDMTETLYLDSDMALKFGNVNTGVEFPDGWDMFACHKEQEEIEVEV